MIDINKHKYFMMQISAEYAIRRLSSEVRRYS